MASPPRGTVELVMDSAQVFDDLYLQQHGFEGTYMTDAVTGGVTMDLRKSLQKGSAVFVGANSPIVRGEPKIGRNKACPCSSGKKYKKCCGSVV
jgi:preprotein translocase subunit SecA